MKVRWINDIKMLAFTAGLGAAAGAIIWVFARLVGLCTMLLWDKLPHAVGFFFLPVIICAFGGVLIGLVHKKFGDYPEELPVVMGKIKRDKHYDYRPMGAMLIAAFLPLVFAGSVGPEAGLTGIIAGLCYWVGDNVRFARERQHAFAKIGEAVTLGTIFHAPLFGIFAVEEDSLLEGGRSSDADTSMPRATKFALYGLAVGGAFLAWHILSVLLGEAASGLPHYSDLTIQWKDLVLLLIYIPAGVLLCLLFVLCEWLTDAAAERIPVIAREIAGGVVIGLIGMGVPMVLFSGEEEMSKLAETFGTYTPLFLIGVCLLKIFLTAFSIRFGFKGGHFFPLIFACTCLGFGLAMVFFGADFGHMVFAAGCITAATLGAQLKKPLAVAMLGLLCFPARMILLLFISAALGAWLIKRLEKGKRNDNE